tara:strand:+ start:16345 stop:17580 length:1236 start_codon:yes stop_codon:yes gene_type:complete
LGKRILIIGYNYSPELTGIGKYSGEMTEWLAQKGYQCHVLTTYPYYPQWKVQEPYRKKRFWFSTEKNSTGSITVYRCPMYVPQEPTGKKRMGSDLSFFMSAIFRLIPLLFSKKFDFVFSVAPSFHVGFLGVFYSRFRKTKLIYHIQDLQIEVAQELKMIQSQKILNICYKAEGYILKRADVISSISERMVEKIEEKAKKKVVLFPNWVDNTVFHPLNDQDKIKKEYGYRPSDKVILYSGAIGEKQGLRAILDVAERLISDKNTHFIICGTGPYKAKLEELARMKQLTNVQFLPLQPKAKFNAFLNMADLHLVIQKSKASDLLLPSKLTAILAVGGLALVTADEGSSLHIVINKFNMGILVATENQNALEDGISLGISSTNSVEIRNNARVYSEKYLSIENVMKTFQKTVFT